MPLPRERMIAAPTASAQGLRELLRSRGPTHVLSPANHVTGASDPPHPTSWITAHLPPHWPQRAERRSMSLEASAPHRLSHGARAVGARCWHHSQITHSHGVTRRRSARVAAVRFGSLHGVALAGLSSARGRRRAAKADQSGGCRLFRLSVTLARHFSVC